MDHQDAEWAVHRLVMEGLSDLDARSDENWAARVDHLCGVLLRLNPDVGRTLAAVVRANAAIQKLLLDLIACSPDPPGKQSSTSRPGCSRISTTTRRAAGLSCPALPHKTTQ